MVRVATQAARRAGVVLAARVGEPLRVETKRSPVDLVTEVDRASERLISRTLLRAFPDHGIQGEEGALRRGTADYRWIIDPLDGTTNFVHGVPLFGVSIGLLRRERLQAGVIYDPIRRELFVAVRGRGAFLNGRRLRVASTRDLARSLLSTGFSTTFQVHAARYLRWFRIFESNSHAVRRIGSTVLSLAYVAAGRLDGFYEQGLWAWDMAAGMLLVEEAGGRISDFHGRPPRLGEGELVASNGRIHHAMLEVLSRSAFRRRT